MSDGDRRPAAGADAQGTRGTGRRLADAPPSEPAAPASAGTPRRWIRVAADRVPTSWFGGICTGIVLVTTAAFGGLATVEEPTPRMSIGEHFLGSGFDLAVIGAEIVDEKREVERPGPGERVLLVDVDAMSLTAETRPSIGGGMSALSGVRIDGLDAAPSVFRRDDGTAAPRLQPGLMTGLRLAWIVPSDWTERTIDVQLPQAVERQNRLSAGTRWDYEGVGAVVPVPVVEGGAGDAR
ncbi:hypothetical protein J2Y69_001401 [Microbacterium resistens]|uniref:Uncharacterized protein n=1 Tax=Microbacterium resistens TaxID=156977 RepID=A0ABU1SB11_9MICO|nr:hypothetical protein [Microbacterium resistens]MDR6866802.1 hypothetical protein [Microbacterium resistens]